MEKKIKPSQKAMILDWMLTGHSITPMDALKMFGCFRLGPRIYRDLARWVNNRFIFAKCKQFEDYKG